MNPGLQARLDNPLTTTEAAVRQLKTMVPITERAQAILDKADKKKLKVSFKKQPATTGLAGVGNPYQTTDIKISKKVVGQINPPTWRSPDDTWSISITVTDPDSESKRWKWIRFKARFKDESAARLWFTSKVEELSKIYEFRYLDLE